mmetsp:Transcript_28247/g.91352  ORF Transcript_28247/g.91352 Transcript_28247/m.91352 type:complete len:237 (+) Transcript_28247:3-713(+)
MIHSLLRQESTPLLAQSMADTFERLEEEYGASARQISHLISALGAETSRVEQEKRYAEAQEEIEETERCLQSMTLESRALDAPTRRGVIERIQRYESDLAKLRRDLDAAMARGERAALLADRQDLEAGADDTQRGRALRAHEKLASMSESLQSSRRTVNETEQIGRGVINDLTDQRHSLLRSKDAVQDTHTHAQQARKILRTMSRRTTTNKLILWIIMILLVVLIAVVLYLWYLPH